MDETRLDKIEIKELEVFANHGVYPEENVLGQKFVISATLFTRTRLAGLTDELSASINYGEVSHMITDFTRKHTYKLLESLAENLAEMLLCSLSGLEKITLKIEKPWAPVGLPLKTVSVEITRKWHTAYIAFGSNMGDKKMYIDNGIRGLAETKGCRIEAISDYLITEPYGVTDQDEFLNGVLKMRTLLTPGELLVRLHQLEQAANRERIIIINVGALRVPGQKHPILGGQRAAGAQDLVLFHSQLSQLGGMGRDGIHLVAAAFQRGNLGIQRSQLL